MKKDNATGYFKKAVFLTLAIFALFAGFLFDANSASAAVCPGTKEPAEGIAGGFSFLQFERAIVPCGRSCDDARTVGLDETGSCTLCHLLIMVKNIFDLMFAWVIIVALIMLTVGGVVYLLSTGDPGRVSAAKGVITKTLFGFSGFLLAWLLVYTVLVFLSAKPANTIGINAGANWWEFTCSTESAFDTVAASYVPGSVVVPGGVYGPVGVDPALGGGTTGAIYDPGISSQTADAHPSLTAFLNCMNTQIPDDYSAARRVSSISDSQGMANCTGAAWSRPPCAHSQNSCHYGGLSCVGQSVAADYGAEEYSTLITNAANACGTSLFGANPYILYEGDHVHISLGTILGCGCN